VGLNMIPNSIKAGKASMGHGAMERRERRSACASLFHCCMAGWSGMVAVQVVAMWCGGADRVWMSDGSVGALGGFRFQISTDLNEMCFNDIQRSFNYSAAGCC
jgi:hypothetical protein